MNIDFESLGLLFELSDFESLAILKGSNCMIILNIKIINLNHLLVNYESCYFRLAFYFNKLTIIRLAYFNFYLYYGLSFY